jgi:hypothetical protein
MWGYFKRKFWGWLGGMIILEAYFYMPNTERKLKSLI